MRDENGKKQFNCLDGSDDATKFLNGLLRKLFSHKEIGEGIISPQDPDDTISDEEKDENDENDKGRKSQRNLLDKAKVDSYLKSNCFELSNTKCVKNINSFK